MTSGLQIPRQGLPHVLVGRSLRPFSGPGLAAVHHRLPSLRSTNVPQTAARRAALVAAFHSEATGLAPRPPAWQLGDANGRRSLLVAVGRRVLAFLLNLLAAGCLWFASRRSRRARCAIDGLVSICSHDPGPSALSGDVRFASPNTSSGLVQCALVGRSAGVRQPEGRCAVHGRRCRLGDGDGKWGSERRRPPRRGGDSDHLSTGAHHTSDRNLPRRRARWLHGRFADVGRSPDPHRVGPPDHHRRLQRRPPQRHLVADHGDRRPTISGTPERALALDTTRKLVDASTNLPAESGFSHSSTAADVNGDRSVDIFVGNLYRLHAGCAARNPAQRRYRPFLTTNRSPPGRPSGRRRRAPLQHGCCSSTSTRTAYPISCSVPITTRPTRVCSLTTAAVTSTTRQHPCRRSREGLPRS